MPFLSMFGGLLRRLSPALLAGSTLLPVGGCDLINPDERVPAYLHIAPFQYTPGMTDGPITTQTPNGPDAWVYANSQLVGAFELPATIPVLAEGDVKIDIMPGIYADAQKGTRLIYPFYKPYSVTRNLAPKQTIQVQPTTSFDANLTHAFDEVKADFNSSFDLDFTIDPATGYKLVSNVHSDPPGLSLQIPPSFGGVGLVQGKRDTTTSFFIESSFYNTLPQKGALVYLELDYRSTMPFAVGVGWSTFSSGTLTRNSELTVFPKEEWTKLYVNLTDEISYVNNPVAKFRIYFEGLPTGDAGQYLALDNIRLVRR